MTAEYELTGGGGEHWAALHSAAQRTPEFHRQTVTSAIVQASPGVNGRCCILGAGPCSDVQLSALLAHFAEVHLLDLDGAALERGVANQRLRSDPRLVLHGDFDVTGVHDAIQQGQDVTPARPAWPFGEFDVVASTFLFSQVVQHVVDHVGHWPQPRWIELVQTLRQQHLELMLDACRPGGVGLFFTDVVSSETLPELATCHGEELPQVLHRAVAAGNFFHGLNPLVIEGLFRQVDSLRARVSQARVSRPWIWNAGSRFYAVLCFWFARR